MVSLTQVFSSPAPISMTDNYIGDQNGIIYSFDTQSIFVDLRSLIVSLDPSYDERGLLSIVLHQDRSRMFLFYTAKDNQNTIAELDMITKQTTPLLKIPHQAKMHNGGKLAFGLDGYLYISVGDGGPQKDPYNHAQDLSTLLGKILRIDVSQPGQYTVPPTNPFVKTPNARPEIYAYGLRNPWGLSFDYNTGVGFLTDAGYNTYEEVDVLHLGANYGWNVKEGTLVTGFGQYKGQKFTEPLYEYWKGQFPEINYYPESSVVIGGYPVGNYYLFADYSGVLMLIDLSGNLVSTIKLAPAKQVKYVKSFGQNQSGIFIMTGETGGPQGPGYVFKIDFE